MEIVEEHLRDLLLRGLQADAAAYERFLKELGAHLRAFLRRRLSQYLGEVEDLVQETLLAIHNQRHHHGSLIRTRRGLRTMVVDALPETVIGASPHDVWEAEGSAPTPSSREMAACAAGGKNCCLIGRRSRPSGSRSSRRSTRAVR